MKTFMILVTVALASAAPQYSNSGVPEAPRPIYGQPGTTSPSGEYNDGQQQGGKLHRHVYIHVAPQDEEDRHNKVIRVPGTPDKHVNIIFVKAPSTSFGANTEIQLPAQNEQKTLVYVLLKKPDSASDIKIRGPAPTRPSKPEVYFIRYKNQEQSGGGPAPGGSYLPPQQQIAGPGSGYGAPAPAPSGQYGTPKF